MLYAILQIGGVNGDSANLPFWEATQMPHPSPRQGEA